MPKTTKKAQLNIRIDVGLLSKYKEFCMENGLDPQGQITNFMKRLIISKYDLQEKLWEILHNGAEQ